MISPHTHSLVQCHPDKLSAHLTDEERDTAVDKFHTLSKAYQVLSDQESKALYDANSQCEFVHNKFNIFLYRSTIIIIITIYLFPRSIITAAQITQKWPLSDTVDLDTMTFDPASKVYSLSCRCGGCYLISESDMEDGVEVSCCTSCTLCVRVLYQLARDER